MITTAEWGLVAGGRLARRLAERLSQRRLQGGHRGVDSDPGGHRTGVRTIDLAETDAVERHPCVVDGRLELTHGFLEHRAAASTVWHHHRAPSMATRSTDGDTNPQRGGQRGRDRSDVRRASDRKSV